jgi:hypothetical protein
MGVPARIENMGDLYDLGIGFPDPTNDFAITMIGYCVATSGQFQVSTDIQDEQHLVQIASPSNVDRYQRYPQVSQGDWSGGERQLIFENANQYYMSTQLDTSKPGHLRILGAYTQVTIPLHPTGTTTLRNPRMIAADALNAYIVTTQGNEVMVIDNLALTVSTITFAGVSGSQGIEIIRGGDAMYILTNGAYVLQLTDAGSIVQVTSDAGSIATLAYFGGSIWYALASPANQLNGATYSFPGNAPAQLAPASTFPKMETQILTVCDSGAGLIVVTGDPSNGLNSYVYAFDGVNQVFLGAIAGFVTDSVNANGTVYLLADTGVGITTNAQSLPIIYEVTGSTISTFDDYREVDKAFQPGKQSANNVYGHLATDGLYLYLFWQGLDTKRYLLSTGAVYDVGQITTNVNIGAATIQGGWLEAGSNRGFVTVVQPLLPPTAAVTGTMTTSYFDFGVPTTNKLFTSIQFQMNSPTPPDPTAVSVQFRTDNNTAFTAVTTTLSLSGQSLVCVLPERTIGNRIQFLISLSGAINPDVNSYSVKATLARVFQVDLACMHNQFTRNGERDPQGLTGRELIATIENCKALGGGEVQLWVPSATALNPDGSPIGYEQINAELQDYQHKTPNTSAGFRVFPDGQYDMEGIVTVTFTEKL